MTTRSLKQVALACLVASLALMWGCGPLDSGRRALVERREAWLQAIKKGSFSDEVFYLGPKGEFYPVLGTALPLTDPLLAKAYQNFPDDKRFKEKISKWTAEGRVAVLVGYYARDIRGPADFLKESPFTAKLSMPGVAPIGPDAAEMVNKSFAGDYFPAFSRWDRIVAYSFRTSLGPGSILSVSWPSGTRDISLWRTPTAEAR